MPPCGLLVGSRCTHVTLVANEKFAATRWTKQFALRVEKVDLNAGRRALSNCQKIYLSLGQIYIGLEAADTTKGSP